MSGKETWGTFKLRQAAVRKIIDASEHSAVNIDPIELEEQLFQGSQNEVEYMTRILKIERGLNSLFTNAEGSTNLILQNNIKDEDEKLHISKSGLSSNARTPTRVLNPFALKSPVTSLPNLRSRVIQCQQQLKKRLQEAQHEGSKYTAVYIGSCEKLLKKISDPNFDLSPKTIERIEEVLLFKENGGEDSKNSFETNTGTPTGSSSADSAKQTAKLNPMESVEKIPISKDKPEADASKTLESVITQVIEWTLKSSNVEQQKVQPNPTNSPVILNPQVNTNSILKTRLNGNTLGPQEGLKIASVETINNSVQAAFNIPGPQVSRAQSFANTPNISINNQFQRSNNFTTGPTIIQVQSQVGASERTNINLQRANSLPQILHVQSLASSTENINFQSNYKRNPETQWRKNAQEALFKGIMKLENDVYNSAGSKEKYFQFFRTLFQFADNSLKQSKEFSNGTPVTSEVTRDAEPSAELDKLKELLLGETPQVQAVVKKDWVEMNAHLSELLKALTVKGPENDRLSKDIKLLPDNFETQVEHFLEKLSSSHVPS